MTVLPSALDIQDEYLRKVLSDVHTCMPGEVVAVREDPPVKPEDPPDRDKRQFVDVQPMLQRAVVDEDGVPQDEPLPLLQMVPVGYLQGGGFFVSVPLRAGDSVLIVFAERSLDNWIQTAAGARKPEQPPVKPTPIRPGDLATHSLQGAIVLPLGPAPRSKLLAGVDASDMVLGLANGTILARFKPDGSVSFAEGPGTNFVALANLVATELDRVKSDLATLKAAVSDGLGAIGEGSAASGTAGKTKFLTSATGVPSSPGSVAATKTKAT